MPQTLARIASLLVVVSLALAPVRADDLEKLRQKLAREDDPADRAKITAKIGEEMLGLIARRYREGAYTDAEDMLADYLKAMREAYDGLLASGREAHHKPKGFKDLEIHLRRGAHRLERIRRSLPLEQQADVQAVIKQMQDMRSDLLEALLTGHVKKEKEQ
ncbi:MAG: hypothetical protein ACE5HB_06790 [Terriglobia bacterium]